MRSTNSGNFLRTRRKLWSRFGFLLGLVTSSIIATQASLALAPPNLRLPHDVEPLRMVLDLNLNPTVDTFTGRVSIDLRVVHSTDHFWLNATDIAITEAQLLQAGKKIRANVVPGGDDFAGFQFASPL